MAQVPVQSAGFRASGLEALDRAEGAVRFSFVIPTIGRVAILSPKVPPRPGAGPLVLAPWVARAAACSAMACRSRLPPAPWDRSTMALTAGPARWSWFTAMPAAQVGAPSRCSPRRPAHPPHEHGSTFLTHDDQNDPGKEDVE